MTGLTVRPATEADFAAIAELTVAAYRADGQTDEEHPYEVVLKNVAGRSTAGEVLVCIASDRVAGAVLFVRPGSRYAELSKHDDEAEFRMLAVHPEAQGRGVGEALVRACLDKAEALGCKSVVICVRDFSAPAQRLYARMGFLREPALDWSPMENVFLLGLRYIF